MEGKKRLIGGAETITPESSTELSIENLYSVKDLVVVVTGGSRGIGLMIAQGFVRNGAKVYIVSRKVSAVKETANALNSMGPGKCYGMAHDLSTQEGCLEFASEFGKLESSLNVLVHNSGIAWSALMADYPESRWDKVFNVNLKAPFFITRDLLPYLDNASASSSGVSRIIMIGSIAGITPQLMTTYAYDTSKAALHHLTRVLASRLCRREDMGGSITVNCIAPGPVPTNMTRALPSEFSARIPIQRMGLPTDMAGAAIFLSSRAAGWITGAVIPVDGGMTHGMVQGNFISSAL